MRGELFRQDGLGAGRHLCEPHQEATCESCCDGEPTVESRSLMDRWVEGETWLHLNLRIGSRFENVEAAEFCAWFEHPAPLAAGHSPNHAILLVNDRVSDLVGDGRNGLEGPMLVELRQAVENAKDVEALLPPRMKVWLVAPHNCNVCAAHSRQLPSQGFIELFPFVRNGEVDVFLLPLREIGRSASFVERPSDMVKAASEVADCVAEHQSQCTGNGLMSAVQYMTMQWRLG